MFNKSFKEWGVTYSEFSPEEVVRITEEFSLPYLDKVAAEQGAKFGAFFVAFSTPSGTCCTPVSI